MEKWEMDRYGATNKKLKNNFYSKFFLIFTTISFVLHFIIFQGLFHKLKNSKIFLRYNKKIILEIPNKENKYFFICPKIKRILLSN